MAVPRMAVSPCREHTSRRAGGSWRLGSGCRARRWPPALSVWTAWSARGRVVRPDGCVGNVVRNRGAVPAVRQQRFRTDVLSQAVAELLADPEARSDQVEGSRRAVEMLGLGELRRGGASPSERAATVVLEIISRTA